MDLRGRGCVETRGTPRPGAGQRAQQLQADSRLALPQQTPLLSAGHETLSTEQCSAGPPALVRCTSQQIQQGKSPGRGPTERETGWKCCGCWLRGLGCGGEEAMRCRALGIGPKQRVCFLACRLLWQACTAGHVQTTADMTRPFWGQQHDGAPREGREGGLVVSGQSFQAFQ